MFRKNQFSLNPFHALTAAAFAAAAPAYAFDPNDPADVALLEEKVAAAVTTATEKLEKKNQELRAEKRRAGEGKVDAVEVERLEAEVEKLTAELKTATTSLKAVTTKAEKAEASLAEATTREQKLLVDNGLQAALAEAGVTDPALAKGAAHLLRGTAKLDIVDVEGVRVVKVGDKLLGDYVKEWGQSPEGKAYATAPNNSGGGASGGGKGTAPNPFAKETFSLTEQSRLYTENPTQAKALATAAGVTLE